MIKTLFFFIMLNKIITDEARRERIAFCSKILSVLKIFHNIQFHSKQESLFICLRLWLYILLLYFIVQIKYNWIIHNWHCIIFQISFIMWPSPSWYTITLRKVHPKRASGKVPLKKRHKQYLVFNVN